MTTTLSSVISEFGGSGTIPINMRSYLKLGATLGWNGGVAEHANNSAIPVSGTLLLSNFVSPADRDFVSDSYTDGADIYFDIGTGTYQSVTGYGTGNGVLAAGLTFLSSNFGAAGSRTTVGKSTYGSTGQTATVIGVYNYDNNGSTGAIVQMSGDQRRSGWGGTGTSGGTSGAAPTTVTQGATTLNFSSASVAAGSYDVTYNLTTWVWPGSSFPDLNGSGTFTFSISIF